MDNGKQNTPGTNQSTNQEKLQTDFKMVLEKGNSAEYKLKVQNNINIRYTKWRTCKSKTFIRSNLCTKWTFQKTVLF